MKQTEQSHIDQYKGILTICDLKVGIIMDML